MPHSTRSWTLILLLLPALTAHPMRKKDPDLPQETPLAAHLKNFTLKKTRRPRTTTQEIEPESTEKKTELEAHQERFFRVSTRPRQYRELEKPPKVKTELEKKVEARALRFAVADNNIDLVKKLLQSCDDPNAPNPVNKKTPIHYATIQGNTKILALLLEHPRINREAIDCYRHPALYYSIYGNYPSCVRLFIEHRAWVGPDIDNNSCLHGAITANKLEALMTVLTSPLDPLTPIEVTDTRLWLEEEITQKPYHTLQERCLVELIKLHKFGLKEYRCDILAKLWGGPFTCNLPNDIGEKLTIYMPFEFARKFVRSFPPDEQEQVASLLAPHYAKRHVLNLCHLLSMVSNNNQTPFELALALERDPLMQTLVNPQKYIMQIHAILQKIPQIKKGLAHNPFAQDPQEMFTKLFIFRLVGQLQQNKQADL